jgi:precorrin-6A/cobalt-precorrin-6A reductase
MTLLLDRGPYTVDGELQLMREHEIGLLVTKDSGGEMTAAKLHAARQLGLAVVVVLRPPVPAESAVISTVSGAMEWLDAQLG